MITKKHTQVIITNRSVILVKETKWCGVLFWEEQRALEQ